MSYSTAIIIDDEFIQSDYLVTQLSRHCPFIEVVNNFQNPVAALKYLRKNSVDLVFLDIEMPEMTGFEFIELLNVDQIPHIIFTTAHSNYAATAFRFSAIDYLLKPIDPKELIEAIKKIAPENKKSNSKGLIKIIESPLDSEDDRLILTEGQSHSFVKIAEIIRIEGSGSYSDFFLLDGKKITTSKRLNFYWEKLQYLSFVRPHQSHIANVKHIIKFNTADGGELFLTNNNRVPISTRSKQEIKIKLGIK